MSELRVILLCSDRLSLPLLQQLAFLRQLAVVAIPAEAVAFRKQVRDLLTGSGIPLLVLSRKGWIDETEAALSLHAVNTGLVCVFPYQIPHSLFQMTAHGFYTVHPGVLPAYRGQDPIFQHIRNREPYAGVTIHRVTEEISGGPVVVTEKIRLYPKDTYGMLQSKLSILAAKLCSALLQLISMDLQVPSRTQEETGACFYPMHEEKDLYIDWDNMNAQDIMALVRACNPWNQGALAKLKGKILRIPEAVVEKNKFTDRAPGHILELEAGGLLVAATERQVLRVPMICTEEGIFLADILSAWGILPGDYFEPV